MITLKELYYLRDKNSHGDEWWDIFNKHRDELNKHKGFSRDMFDDMIAEHKANIIKEILQ